MNVCFRCVFSFSLWPHWLQHAMSFPLSQEFAQIHVHWVSDGLSNHLIHCPLLLLLSIFPRSGSFPLSWLFISDGQSIGVSTLASVLPVNVQGWFSLGLTVWSPCCPKDSQESSSSPSKTLILQHSAFFIVQFSNPYMSTGKTIALTIWAFVGKMMSLFFNTPSRFVKLSS